MEMAISVIEAQKKTFSRTDSVVFVILKTTIAPTIIKSKSMIGLCDIPSGIIISRGNIMQWIRHNTAAEIPM